MMIIDEMFKNGILEIGIYDKDFDKIEQIVIRNEPKDEKKVYVLESEE